MPGQMCWLPAKQFDREMVLHLRNHDRESWRPYTAYPQYSVTDYDIPSGSKGWATCQKLMRAGWKLVPTVIGEQELCTVPVRWSENWRHQ